MLGELTPVSQSFITCHLFRSPVSLDRTAFLRSALAPPSPLPARKGSAQYLPSSRTPLPQHAAAAAAAAAAGGDGDAPCASRRAPDLADGLGAGPAYEGHGGNRAGGRSEGRAAGGADTAESPRRRNRDGGPVPPSPLPAPPPPTPTQSSPCPRPVPLFTLDRATWGPPARSRRRSRPVQPGRPEPTRTPPSGGSCLRGVRLSRQGPGGGRARTEAPDTHRRKEHAAILPSPPVPPPPPPLLRPDPLSPVFTTIPPPSHYSRSPPWRRLGPEGGGRMEGGRESERATEGGGSGEGREEREGETLEADPPYPHPQLKAGFRLCAHIVRDTSAAGRPPRARGPGAARARRAGPIPRPPSRGCQRRGIAERAPPLGVAPRGPSRGARGGIRDRRIPCGLGLRVMCPRARREAGPDVACARTRLRRTRPLQICASAVESGIRTAGVRSWRGVRPPRRWCSACPKPGELPGVASPEARTGPLSVWRGPTGFRRRFFSSRRLFKSGGEGLCSMMACA